MKKYFLFALIFILQESFCFSQSLVYRHYTVEDGLLASTIYYCMQDSKGFMWIGTENGVNRFDGKIFQQFTMADGLSDNEVFKIFEDSKGRIWFLTFNGHLSYYFQNKFFNEQNDTLLKSAFVGASYTQFVEDKNGRIFLGTLSQTLVMIDSNKVNTFFIPTASQFGFFSIFRNSDSVFIFTGECLYLFSTGGLVTLKTFGKSGIALNNCFSHYHDKAFYYHQSGIKIISKQIDAVIISFELLNDNPSVSALMSITEDNAKNLWVGFWSKGITLFSYDKHRRYKEVQHFLPGKSLHAVYVDKEENTWFSTEGEGLFLLPATNKNFLSYTEKDGLANESIYTVKKDNNGKLWLGCLNSYLTKIDAEGISNIQISGKNRSSRINDIIFDNGNIICGSSSGVYYLTESRKKEGIPVYGFEKNWSWEVPLKAFSKDSNGNISANFSGGVHKLKKSNNEPHLYFEYDFKKEDYGIRTYTHFYDQGGRLWVGNIHGLGVIKDNKIISFRDSNNLLRSRIVQIKETADSALVLSTAENGVIFFKNNRVINHFSVNEGLASNICRKICVKNETIWISTNMGLTKLNYKNNLISDVKTYTNDEGLLSDDVRDVLADDSIIYVATSKGLCIIKNTEEISKIFPPYVYVTGFSADQKQYSINSGNIEFPYSINSVKINFIAPTYINPKKIAYQYSLNGTETSWTDTKNNFVEFSNLLPGHYQFHVRAKKTDSDWSNTAAVEFTIIPPYWQTWWFRTLFLMVITSLTVYLIMQVFAKRLKREKLKLEQQQMITDERMRISSDIHDDLGSGLTQITILSEVVKQDSNLPEKVKKQLDKISDSSHELIDKMGEIIWALNSSNDSLKNSIAYIHEYALDFAEVHDLQAELIFPQPIPDKIVSAITRRNLFLVIKEALNNILKHSAATRFLVNITMEDSRLHLLIKDNGKGFESDKIVYGNGIRNMEKRIKEINGEIIFNSFTGETTEIKIDVPV